jgi:hypothetical protein
MLKKTKGDGMIDFAQVAANALWVLGLALLLAVWSYARYEAHLEGVKTREMLGRLSYSLWINGGLLLFVVGMALTEDRWWARGLWILVGVGFLVDSGMRVAEARKETHEATLSEVMDPEIPPKSEDSYD